ncbi:hypothetical protein DY926_15170 [Komagataeibacter melaceti]|uniref:Uncharacterized protein n=1 Tax=Komagataeibacter melaceti TaxID=2766577 RepID=A0A371YWV9_9PROT|nr:hypothetical protein [Komagataeibacter melaceti]RFD18717.1 hypothetical protein DY926_15170 [Komagataeibacter melaceti]
MFAVDSNRPRPTRLWALVKDGVVTAIKSSLARQPQPFGPEAGRVVEVTGTDVQVGYLVDQMGNVTPRENRTGPIPDGRPAYLEGPPVPAVASGPLGRALASVGVMPTKDPDHPANWSKNAAPEQKEAVDGHADHPQA